MSRFSIIHFDSAALAPEVRFPTFASGIVNFDLEPDPAIPFEARADAWKVGGLVLSSLSATPLVWRRPEARLLADGADHLYINLHLGGQVRADCGSGVVCCGTGSLLVLDLRQPCLLQVSQMRSLSIAAPREEVLPRLGGFDPHGLTASGGLTPLLIRTVQAVADSLPELDASHVPAVECMLVDLVVAALAEALHAAHDRSSRDEALVSRVRGHMEARLAEPLDAGALCAALGVSRSSLYRALQPHGGVQRYLQALRLRRVRAHLETPGAVRSLDDLAELTGFADRAHLARAFKRAFGATPGEVRARAASSGPPTPAVDDEAARRFGAWMRERD
ncbi:helix-turn-helix domain-containing protein [Phenylobacterium sp.]|uniref:helix-turn-helix domain-containing protein n=1 Tax=Phenylobacterium sp. TaxID=1871053 RepID=UPI0025D30505|nr:helix-turn-helix domain-containing protein [Phenylobacterium sp.]